MQPVKTVFIVGNKKHEAIVDVPTAITIGEVARMIVGPDAVVPAIDDRMVSACAEGGNFVQVMAYEQGARAQGLINDQPTQRVTQNDMQALHPAPTAQSAPIPQQAFTQPVARCAMVEVAKQQWQQRLDEICAEVRKAVAHNAGHGNMSHTYIVPAGWAKDVALALGDEFHVTRKRKKDDRVVINLWKKPKGAGSLPRRTFRKTGHLSWVVGRKGAAMAAAALVATCLATGQGPIETVKDAASGAAGAIRSLTTDGADDAAGLTADPGSPPSAVTFADYCAWEDQDQLACTLDLASEAWSRRQASIH